MEVGVYALDWHRLPIGVYGLGEDNECRDFRSLSSSAQAEERQRSVLSVRPFASILACERCVRALNAWYGGVKIYN